MALGVPQNPGEMLRWSSPMERKAAPHTSLHWAPCCWSMPDCNQCNLLKLIYFLSSFAHKYSC